MKRYFKVNAPRSFSLAAFSSRMEVKASTIWEGLSARRWETCQGVVKVLRFNQYSQGQSKRRPHVLINVC